MGLLVKGEWQDKWYDTDKSKGDFEREAAQLRNWITSDGSAGPSGKAGFKAESGRYHLYVSLACPWAHRTLIFRKLKQLESHIDVSIVSPDMLDKGWSFKTDEGSSGDALFNSDYLHQLYTRHQDDYSGRVTVPLLWDKKQNCIVSNESAEIIRMLNSAFDELLEHHSDPTAGSDVGDDSHGYSLDHTLDYSYDYYPNELRADIDQINSWVYSDINNGVYRCGFATTQNAYEKAYQVLFDALDKVEGILSAQRYLVGKQLTEADWRLFTTLIRFDAVYHGHFKCNRQRLEDFPNISEYVRELYQVPGIADTVSFEHIKRHYYYSHDMINPTRVVPKGPSIDYSRPHNRNRFSTSVT